MADYDFMLVLLFHLGNESYALDCSRIVEIIPRIELRRIYQAPNYVAGLFNYRGKLVPVIDLCQLIQGTSCNFCLSTRIIIVNYSVNEEQLQYLGLMAEKVTDTFYQAQPNTGEMSNRHQTATHLGNIIFNEQKMIQVIGIEALLQERELNRLLMSEGMRG